MFPDNIRIRALYENFLDITLCKYEQKAVEMGCIVLSWNISAIVVLHPNTSLIPNSNNCSNITVPLTPEEQTYARAAWQYFVKNYPASNGIY